jgi:peptidoglycan/xylan/chitin deacetylase (PgdA/CDA1 family)
MAVSLRTRTRLALAGLLHGTGALAAHRRMRREDEVCVIGLHRILREPELAQAASQPAIVMREETFDRLLAFLKARFEVLTLDDFLAADGVRPGRRPRCLITFDDGWCDTYSTAWPLLRRHGLPATVFLATGFLGTERTFWVERLLHQWQDEARRSALRAHFWRQIPAAVAGDDPEPIIETLKRTAAERRERILEPVLDGAEAGPADRMMSWEQAREMASDGISFGAHTVTHPLLTFEQDETVERELVESRRAIEEQLGRPACAFAYPNGDWDERVRSFVLRNFEYAFTTASGWHRRGQDRFTIRRILLHEGNVTGSDGRFSAAATSLTLTGWR